MIRLDISSNAQEIVTRLDGFPGEMALAIAHAMDEQNELTVGYIDATKLSRRGATTLGVVTNRLRSSVRPSAAVVQGDTVESSIGSNVAYAAAHEFGFDGVVQVKGFTRRRFGTKSSGGQKVVDTVTRFDTKTGRVSRVTNKKAKYQTGVITVKPFSRHMKMPERSYIRTGISERSAFYSSAISFAIVDAWQKGGQS